MDNSAWQYNEFTHTGADFSSVDEVRKYDEGMGRLRDIKKEIETILTTLDLAPDSTILEIGTGTGEFAIAAARRCKKVYAIDISEAMISYAQEKAVNRGVNNIEFMRGGFLTYEHNVEPLDAVVTQLALHHLSDFWKAIALRRIWSMLKEGGRLYLRDVIFSFEPKDVDAAIELWIKECAEKGGEVFAGRIARHVRNEDSTFDWIMEGLLKAAGFKILKNESTEMMFATYLCEKVI